MKKGLLLSALTSLYLFGGGDIQPVEPVVEAPAPQAASSSFGIFSDIYAKGEIRPRYEYVNTDNAVGDAKALTNRLTLGIGAKLFGVEGLSTYLEATNVSGSGNYYDFRLQDAADNGRYNAVADPSQTRVTQAYVDYQFGSTLLRAGRQGVNLDNQRFVGTVNWRQMPQTYDAAALIDHSVENLELLGAYVWRVNTIFDADTTKAVGDAFDTNTVLLHAAYTVMPELKLTAYGYLVEDFSDTYGLFASGKVDLAGTKVGYRAEYARQTDPSIGNGSADADYYNFEANANMNGLLLGARYEVLSAGKGGNGAFQTPLATLHGQNGWADMFLSTPANGLVDLNGMIGYNSSAFGVAKAIYHDFSSDKGSIDYGTELDLLYTRAIPGVKGLKGLIKASWYNSDSYKVDTNKVWVMLDYKF
jgi:hypothetical protein